MTEQPPPPDTTDHRWAPEPAGPPHFEPPAPPPLARRPHRGLRRAGVATVILAAGMAAGVGVASIRAVPASSSSVLPSSSSGAGSSGGGSSSAANGSGSGSAPAGGGSSSATSAVDRSVVDIDGTLAAGGEVAGTGIVLTSTGDILTNNHVIEGTSHLTAQIDGAGTVYTATVVGTDAAADIAVIHIDASGLSVATFGDSSTVTVGEAVTAIGNALGQGGTPAQSTGAITSLNQTITAADETAAPETLNGMFEMNAFIQPGDSGGPLVDASDRVIGIDTAALSSGPTQTSGSNVGYAIPIDNALAIARQIEAGTASTTVQIGTRGVLGVEVASSASAAGAQVAGVEPGSGAATAGITAGDVITAVNGATVTSASSLSAALTGKAPGVTVSVAWTDAAGATHTASVQLQAGPPA